MLHRLIYRLYGLQSAMLDLVRKALRQLVSYVPIFDDFCEETIILNDKKDEVLYAELKNKHSLPSMKASKCTVEYKLQQRDEWFEKLRMLEDRLSDTYAAKSLWLRDLAALVAQLNVSFVFLRKDFFLSFWVSSNLDIFCV